ncbi:MAG TPA: protein kinase, partial [Kofleriaceae bacterium]|nr:protein kinase [Kofleriaceae bacterium]
GLHHAHERRSNDGRPLGIVHRDVTPSNVMVSFEGNVKLVDFGVAKAANRAVETESGTVKGKISYLSPEQCRGSRVDRRSDMFSLGIVMWELLTGQRLYRRTSDFEAMNAIVHEPPPPPSSRRREIPRAVDEIVLRLLAKDVAGRFQTASAVVEAVEDASMRAGMLLSTSALSRLIHDLFGLRAEPWLELDRETQPSALVTLTSRPVSRDRSAEPAEDVEAGLASVLDLSGPGGENGASERAGETRELSDADLVLTPREGPIIARAGVASPGMTGKPPARVPPPVPSRTDVDDPALDSTIRVTPPPGALAEAEAVRPSARPSAGHVNSTLLGVGPPASSSTREHAAVLPAPNRAAQLPPPRIATASAPMPVVDDPPHGTPDRAGSGPRYAPNPPGVHPAAAPRPVRPKPRGGRFPWPLLLVVVVAAAVGVVIVWFAMREPTRGARPEATSPEPAGLAGAAATTDTTAHDPAPAGSAAPAGAGATIEAQGHGDSQDQGHREGEDPGPGPPPNATGETPSPRVPAEPTAPPGSAPEPPAPPAPASPTGTPPGGPVSAPPPPTAAVTHPARHRSSPPRDPDKAPAAPPAPDPHAARSAAASQPAGQSTTAWLSGLYHHDEFATIVQFCTGTRITVEIASVCVLAACQQHATAQAKTWMSEVAQPSRGTALARCRQLGNEDL